MTVVTAGHLGAPPLLVETRRADPPIGLVTLTVMLGLSMAIIDTTIVNVALANMAGNLGATIDEIAWVATGYILANVIIMPLNGWLTALLGRRTFYATSLAIFTIASLLCGTAHNVAELVTFRIIQGIGGGALQPTAQSILFESYPPEKRGQAMAIFGLGAMVGPAIGPTLGGWIVDNFNWPLIFYINIPIGILAFFMTLAFIRDPDYIKKPERGADWIGLSAMAIGIASLQYVLERGQREDWFDSATITLLSVLSVATLTFFIVREIRDKHPFVDLRVFRSRSFTGGNIIGIISGFGLYGLNLMLPLFYENVLHFNATQTGFALLPGAGATALSMPLATIIPRKIGARSTIAIGLLIFAWGSWWMGSLNQYVGYWDVFWPRAVQGFALGFVFVPLSTSTLSEIDRGDLAGASGIYTLIRQLGGGIGIAILQLILLRRQDTAQSILSSSITYANPAVAQMLANATNHAQALAQLGAMVESNATVLAYNYIFRLSAIIFLLSIPTVLLLRPSKPDAPTVPLAE
jgi:DHA2 family multidrug resistance protein